MAFCLEGFSAYEGFCEITDKSIIKELYDSAEVMMYVNSDENYLYDVYICDNNVGKNYKKDYILYIFFEGDNGELCRCICMYYSTFKFLFDSLHVIKPIRIPGVRGKYLSNNCPEHYINYYMLGNGVGDINFQPNMGGIVDVVWFAKTNGCAVCAAITNMKYEKEYLVELYHVNFNSKRIDRRITIPYSAMRLIYKAFL